MSALVEVEHLAKTFVRRRRRGLRVERSEHPAVDDVSFTVQAGEFVGYLGPNGAGKSTTIKMLTGILVPTAGRVRVDGLDPSRQRIDLARRVGVVFGQRTQLWWDLPLRESYDLLRHVYRVPAAEATARLDRLIDLLDLGPFLDTPVRQLSLGQRMRGDLVAAFLHGPSLVYLDEPTIGLDVVAKAAVRRFLAAENAERGTTILLTSHDLADIERLCPRVLVIDQGRLVHDGPLADLVARLGTGRTLVVTTPEPMAPIVLARTEVVRTDGPKQWLRFDGHPAEVIAAVAAAVPVVDLTIEEPSVEQVVSRLYAERGR
ncbi:MAG: ATP-binding cassette domain-containing protein [Acidimicrobiales bacterium]